MSARNQSLTAKIRQIARWVDVEEFDADDTGDKVDAYNATREIFLMLSAYAEMVVVDKLNAITIEIDPGEALVSLPLKWTEREQRPPPESWRRWPPDPPAQFIVDDLAKMVPPFWWQV